MLYDKGTLQVTVKFRAAMAALRPLRTITEVCVGLDLLNQFQDEIPGHVLRIQELLSLIWQKRVLVYKKGNKVDEKIALALTQNISLLVEAAEEFTAIKAFLVSSAVLVVLQANCKIFVYSDASSASPDLSITNDLSLPPWRQTPLAPGRISASHTEAPPE